MGRGGFVLFGMMMEGLLDKVTFGQKPEGSEEFPGILLEGFLGCEASNQRP